MKKLLKFVALSALVAPLAAVAEIRIGVLDMQAVYAQSKEAQTISKTMEGKFSKKQAELRKTNEELKALDDKLQKNADTMPKKDLAALGKQRNEKFRAYQTQMMALREGVAKETQAFEQKMRPKIDRAIEDIVKAQKLDMVVHKGNLVYVDKQYDITKDVVRKLDKL
jgi:outer membrane protein